MKRTKLPFKLGTKYKWNGKIITYAGGYRTVASFKDTENNMLTVEDSTKFAEILKGKVKAKQAKIAFGKKRN